jgi:hypothetical protein
MESQNYIASQLQTFGILNSKILEFFMLEYSIKSGLLDLLEHEFLHIDEIKDKLQVKCNTRNFQDFLDKLYVNNHLLREGPVDSPKYKTAQDAYLNSNPNNIRGFILYFAGRPLRNVTRLEDYIYGKVKFDTFEEIYNSEETTFNFLRTMILFQTRNFESIAAKFDFTPFKSLADIGGGLGGFAAIVKRHNPELTCTTYDLPKVEPLVKRYLAEQKVEVNAEFGDMFSDEFPKADIISMGNIIHDWGEEKKKLLFKKAYDAINPNGLFMIVESFIDNERKEATQGLDISCLMLTECGEGFNVSIKDIEKYAQEAGFKKVENLKEKIGTDVAVCYK